MFGINELKPTIRITDNTVECPVGGCTVELPRQRNVFRCDPSFYCASHQIYISPSTFEYQTELDNLLWHGSDDTALLSAIRSSKRECRMARDNSEDAVTWNVFRYLERSALLGGLLSSWIGCPITNPQVIYWSHCISEVGTWSALKRARVEFGEGEYHGSEPDLIIVAPEAIIWIEAKVNAPNRVPGKAKTRTGYLAGGAGWFEQVFQSDYDEVALANAFYELMRFWLLGSWLSVRMDRPFFLISLVLERNDIDLVKQFAKHIKATHARQHLRQSWESIYEYVNAGERVGIDRRAALLRYFSNKSLGYDGSGRLRPAFDVPHIPESRD
jgi:hypothetical protein